MPNKSQKERKALLNALGVKIIYEYPQDYHKTECSICLKKIKKGEQLTLPCGHVFHGECLKHWAIKNTNNGICDCHQPVSNRRINLFKQGENIFSCPCCRVEYTHDVYTSEIKKVIAKVHFKNKGDNVIHYITDYRDTLEYVPTQEEYGNTGISGKWATILTSLKQAWENGDTDIYAVERLTPEREFTLTNENVILPPLDKETGNVKPFAENTDIVFKMIDIKELNKALNE